MELSTLLYLYFYFLGRKALIAHEYVTNVSFAHVDTGRVRYW
jgi:hypothetical protein